MASLHGLIRKNYGKLFAERLVLDADRDTTPAYAPLGLLPTAEPTNAAEGALYFDSTSHALTAYNGSAWEQVGASPSGNVAIGGTLDVTGTSTLGVLGAGASTLASATVTGTITPGSTSNMTAGAGITGGVGTIYAPRVYRMGNIIKTEISITLTGLNSSAADDIIGVQTTAACHLGQITTAINGAIFRGQVSCLVAPATGINDIDVYSATEATGTEDAAIGSITAVKLVDSGAAWTQGRTLPTTGILAANKYLYLVGSGAGADATYSAGQLLIELWGYVA